MLFGIYFFPSESHWLLFSPNSIKFYKKKTINKYPSKAICYYKQNSIEQKYIKNMHKLGKIRMLSTKFDGR